VRLPRSGSVRTARYRRDLAARLATLDVKPPRRRRPSLPGEALERADEMERRAERHPCHRCPDRAEHERWAARASKLESEIAALERKIRARTETLGRQFDRVLRVLERLRYVREFTLTERGERLARIYGEGDILLAEALAEASFVGVSAPELAALVSAFVYESRERVPQRPAEMPTDEMRDRYRALQALWRGVRKAEEQNQVELCRELDPGFMATAFHWAEGKGLEDVLLETEMAAGDFVRTCKQLIDVLRQVEEVADPEVTPVAAQARGAVNRGVVSYTGV
jgi:ATP-dependent RNA helicase HelY